MNASVNMEVKLNVNEVNQNLQNFGWVDYVVFTFMLICCAAIGVYFGFIDKNRKRKHGDSNEVAQEYLMGGRKMNVLPVAMSLVASWISAISLLGLVTEMYLYGTQYLFVICSLILSGILTSYVYLPVFHDLHLESCCQYLEKRFDRRMRLFGSVLYALHTVTFLPVVIYVPALAFNQVTGVNIHIVTPIVCAICIFYTLVGGIKAVVFSDCIQTFIMIGTMIVIVSKTTLDAHGFNNVWEKSWSGDRIAFPELTLDLHVRHSVLALLVGGTTYFTYTFTMTQSMIQRYLALPTLRNARYALSIHVLTISLLIAICCYAGLIAYTLYSHCDPLKTKLIRAPDQLLPLLVMDSLGNYPGIPGLFVAGIFSAALSSLSTCLNAMAAIVLEDFYKPFIKNSLTEKQTSYLMKGVVFLVGFTSTALVFVVERLGTVLQLQMSIAGVTAGPVFGVFTMGVLMPWVKRKGAFYGGVSGLLAMSWILYKAQADLISGNLTFSQKPVYTDSCNYNFELDSTANETHSTVEDEGTFEIYHVSYLFYTFIGAVVTIFIGSIVSLLLDARCVSDPVLFSPVIRKFLSTPRSLLIVRQNSMERSSVVHAFEIQDNKVQ